MVAVALFGSFPSELGHAVAAAVGEQPAQDRPVPVPAAL
jgi:hypothetical protein